MEPNQEPVAKPSYMQRVTPLSKYLALLLFILMPFIGGWIGYTFAPEKVVEVEKIVAIDLLPQASDEIEALFREQLGHEYGNDKEIVFLYESPQSGVRYYATVNHGSASSIVFRYSPHQKTFAQTNFHIDAVVGDSVSPNGRHLLMIYNSDNSTTTYASVVDFETETELQRIQVSPPETLWSGQCGYDGATFDINWIDNSSLKYGVFSLPLIEGVCDAVLVEYRTLNVENF